MRIEEETIDWWELHDGDYIAIAADRDGLTRSRVFPGPAIDLADLLRVAREALEDDSDEG